MAFHIPGKKSISDINVTPLVDVMLVLLIIFMVTAPLMLNGIKIELPKTQESNPINLNTEHLILSFSKDAELFIGDHKYLQSEIVEKINSEFKSKKTDVIFLRADFSLDYGKVASLLSFLKASGIIKVALVTEIDETRESRTSRN